MKKPRGRPRKGCYWDGARGWVKLSFAAPTPPVVRRAPVIVRTVVIDPAVEYRRTQERLQRDQDEEERKVQEEVREEVQEEAERVEREELHEVERIRRENEEREEREERERREAPRRYALQLHSNVQRLQHKVMPPVYYFDVNGAFRELGKEPVAKPKAVIKKERKKRGSRRVVGPLMTASGWLSVGESEYMSE
jgi:vacuolar-type H+-ATPase subunit I/STV1